jgi:hypothetical protein
VVPDPLKRSLLALLIFCVCVGLGVNRTSPGTGLFGSGSQDDPHVLDWRGDAEGPTTGMKPGARILTSTFWNTWVEDQWNGAGFAPILVNETCSGNGCALASTAVFQSMSAWPIAGTVHNWTFRQSIAGLTGTGTVAWYGGNSAYASATKQMECGWTNPTQGQSCVPGAATDFAVAVGDVTYLKAEAQSLTHVDPFQSAYQDMRWSFTPDPPYDCMQPLLGTGRADSAGLRYAAPGTGGSSISESVQEDKTFIFPRAGEISRLVIRIRTGRFSAGQTARFTIQYAADRDSAMTDTSHSCDITAAVTGCDDFGELPLAVAKGGRMVVKADPVVTGFSNAQFAVGVAYEPDDCATWAAAFATDDSILGGVTDHFPTQGNDMRDTGHGVWCSGPLPNDGTNGPGGSDFQVNSIFYHMRQTITGTDEHTMQLETEQGVTYGPGCTIDVSVGPEFDGNECCSTEDGTGCNGNASTATPYTWTAGNCFVLEHGSVDVSTTTGLSVSMGMTGGPSPP